MTLRRVYRAFGRTVRGARPGWWKRVALVAGVAAFAATPGEAQLRTSGAVSVETRGFFQAPLDDAQSMHSAAVAVEPQLDFAWDRGRQVLTFEPFLRVDAVDSKRSHFDVRTLAWERAWSDWELRAGVRTVFWGVTESYHLIDVLNQTDQVESIDGEDKLGQPMVSLAAVRGWGTVDLFVLPGFRERTFPGSDGRLRAPLPVTDDAVYVSGAGSEHLDVAVRWSHSFGAFDLGAAYFRGTNREPWLEVVDVGTGPALRPHYDLVDQFSIDAQMTTGPWLFKLESLTRNGREQGRHWALVAGFERTLYQILASDADLGLIAEYLYDDRGISGPTPFEDDVFAGLRLALNDAQATDVVAGVIVDRESGSALAKVKSTRRIGGGWTAELQGIGLFGTAATDVLYGLRRDDHVALTITRWF